MLNFNIILLAVTEIIIILKTLVIMMPVCL